MRETRNRATAPSEKVTSPSVMPWLTWVRIGRISTTLSMGSKLTQSTKQSGACRRYISPHVEIDQKKFECGKVSRSLLQHAGRQRDLFVFRLIRHFVKLLSF